MKKFFLAIALFSLLVPSITLQAAGTKRYRKDETQRPTTPTKQQTLAHVKKIMTKKGISAKKRFALLIKIVRKTIPEEDISDGLKVILEITDLIEKEEIIFEPNLVEQILIETGWQKELNAEEEPSESSDEEYFEDRDESESEEEPLFRRRIPVIRRPRMIRPIALR